jgi:phage-related minor tail protein
MTPFDETVETWTVAIDADTTALQAELRTAASLGRQFSTALTGAFEGIAIKGRSVAEVLKGLALRLSDLVLKAAFKPFEQGFGGVVSGLLSGGLGFAKGGVFQGGIPVPFAKGGVIQSPIAFPLGAGRMGIAGERGAEAILPLSRGPDGRLGVAAPRGAASMQITFNIATPDADSFRRSETQIAAMVARATALGQRNA